MKKDKARLSEISKGLTQAIKEKDNNLFNGYFEDKLLQEIFIELRLLGLKLDAPLVCMDLYYPYYEITADLVRQIEDYLHPIRRWFKTHIDTLIASVISITAIIISIVK